MKKKKTLKILRNDKAIFNGKFIDLPIKEAYLISKSIELFDDEDPCIIHQSYVIKEYADQLFTLFKMHETNTIIGKPGKFNQEVFDNNILKATELYNYLIKINS